VALGGDFDRKKLLQRANEARKKKRRRLAIGLYRELIAVDPNDPDVHAQLAPLLAKDRQFFDALLSFRAAAEGFLRKSESDRALSSYYDAAHHLPTEIEVWQAIARLQAARGKTDEALRALLQGRGKFRKRRQRAQAIHLLRAAHDMTPWKPDIVLDLARLLARSRQGREARLLLEGLAHQTRGRALAHTRGLQFRITWHPRFAWAWFQAWKASLATPDAASAKQRTKRARTAKA